MSLINSLYSLVNKPQHERSISFLSHNNTPVNNFCSIIPIISPSLISTSFGQSLVTLSVLVLYLVLYIYFSDSKKGVEFRVLTSLIIGNLVVLIFTFNDWFNLSYQIILCNDYKNGNINLYQVSELIETYKLINMTELYFGCVKDIGAKYSVLVYRQFIGFFIDGTKDAFKIIQSYVQ